MCDVGGGVRICIFMVAIKAIFTMILGWLLCLVSWKIERLDPGLFL